MPDFKIYSPANAPSETAGTLVGLTHQLGMLPNVFAVLGGNAPALAAFTALNQRFSESSLSPLEREIVQTTASVENACGYCVAGHTAFACMLDLDSEVIDAVRRARG